MSSIHRERAVLRKLPSTMRTAQWHSIAGGIEKNLKLVTDAKLPKAAESLPKDHTLVLVSHASLNHLDYKIAEMPFGSALYSKPATPGLDFAGTVFATARDDLKVGQTVCGRTEPPACGTLAEYVVVGKEGIAPIPDNTPLEKAACIGICGVTALQTITPFVGAGSKVLINGGSGGVGVFAIQMAKALDCAHITVVCSEQNAALCRELGADEVIDYKKEDPITVLKKSGLCYDHILDTVFTNPSLYWQCHHYLAPKGTYISVGLPPTFKTFRTLLAIHLLPSFLGGGKRKFKFHSVTADPENFAQVAQWVQQRKIKPVIEEVFGLDRAAEAYARLKTGRTTGKLVVVVHR